MKRSLTIGLAVLFLAGCGGGGSMSVPTGTNAASSSQKSHVRYTHTITKTYDYTLTAPAYPSGFSPYCPEVNLVVWNPGPPPSAPESFSLVGGQEPIFNVGRCNAATGDHIHLQLEINYGNMRFIPETGAFSLDSVDDSGALLTVSDYTTGDSSNYLVYLSW
jgi:hypothetical protein